MWQNFLHRQQGIAEGITVFLGNLLGYPRGLRGEEIPIGARLFAVIDTLDAMTSDRSYRQGLSFDRAKEEIRSMAGSQFDPLAVKLFLAEEKALRDMVAIKCSHPEGI